MPLPSQIQEEEQLQRLEAPSAMLQEAPASQDAGANGRAITGVISDPSGGVTAGVQVTVLNASGAPVQTATTDRNGRFTVTGLTLQTDVITTSASCGSNPARTTDERFEAAKRSEHPELQFRGVRHPVFVPRRVPDDVHVRVGDAGQLLQLGDDFDGKALGGGAARCRQRHANADPVVGVDGDLVDEAELVDVDGDLGVKDGREHLDDLRPHRERLDGVTTLEDRAGCRTRLRSHVRRVFVGELDDVVWHGRWSRYSASVDTTSSFASTAERSVCQARLAHFTRAG